MILTIPNLLNCEAMVWHFRDGWPLNRMGYDRIVGGSGAGCNGETANSARGTYLQQETRTILLTVFGVRFILEVYLRGAFCAGRRLP
jgi:hypothetical protein